ncbi:hypothetical protein VNI00_008450 [Paramarasmius palmivorus]|uniref:F-box domain-containing protein n=1 Tax=Paramarasmius palmivorus TaxID=297713 RepID=A0AAW0CTH3_9AGAR
MRFLLEKNRRRRLTIQFRVPEYSWERYLDEADEEQVREYNAETHRPILSELVRHSARWKAVDPTVMLDEEFILPQVLPHLITLSVLRREVLDDSNQDLEWIPDPGPPSPLFAPRLSDLSLAGIEIHLIEPVNLNSLMYLSLEGYYIDTLLDVLRHAPNLVDVHIKGPTLAPASSNLVVTSQLKTLEAKYLRSIVPGLFRHLTLSHLSSLHVSETYANYSAVETPLTEFSLNITKTLTHEQLVELLAVLPLVTSFNIEDQRSRLDQGSPFLVTDELLRRLTITSESDVILPGVASLQLHFKVHPAANCLREMVRSRLQRPLDQRLKKLRLVFHYCPLRKLGRVGKCIEDLRKEDLDLDVESTDLDIRLSGAESDASFD